ncbi:hypothetical protein FRC11_013123 [Ceratobasidium sp. 423]|nr:hypothetical protein FRC11_013123 [Ceratobasidium sp. 423]
MNSHWRPRKVTIEVEKDPDADINEIVPPPAKRRRGRPPKNDTSIEVNVERAPPSSSILPMDSTMANTSTAPNTSRLNSPPRDENPTLPASPTPGVQLDNALPSEKSGEEPQPNVRSNKTWDGTSWTNDNLSREGLGLLLYLGHAGSPCPSNEKAWDLHVGDLNGFKTIKVRYCTCDRAIHRRQQLLQVGLFPCSHLRPKSAMTLPLLEMYDLLTTVGRTSGHKYYLVLEEFTNPGFPGQVEDRYRELMWTHRRYMHLAQLRLASHLFPAHPDIDATPGDQSFDCVACPQPGFNFEWAKVSEEEWCWFRLWYSYDGNFWSVQKSKKVDAADVACSDDLAYFVMKEIYKTWTESIPQPKREEKPVCDNHKARNDTSIRGVELHKSLLYRASWNGGFFQGRAVQLCRLCARDLTLAPAEAPWRLFANRDHV